MNISHEGVGLIARAALMSVLIIVGAVFLALVGTSRRRKTYMLVGGLGGLSIGVVVAELLAHSIRTDVSAICGCIGMMAGWCVAWLYARHVPRESK